MLRLKVYVEHAGFFSDCLSALRRSNANAGILIFSISLGLHLENHASVKCVQVEHLRHECYECFEWYENDFSIQIRAKRENVRGMCQN